MGKNISAKQSAPEVADKIKLGWFTFSCSEDNTIVMTELMNDYWQEWKRDFDFRHAKILKSDNIFDELDIAFIEGAIASEGQAEKLREIRKKSKKLVAVGNCAVIGRPAGQRNDFNEAQKKEIEYLISRFASLPKVLRVSDVVKVDKSIPGCPMDPEVFLATLNQLLKELSFKRKNNNNNIKKLN